eukprot:m.199036 g.199036  ORF g.199036 m.199036 type:complete len:101 (+) comp53801_c0_seq1:842-1144(+)
MSGTTITFRYQALLRSGRDIFYKGVTDGEATKLPTLIEMCRAKKAALDQARQDKVLNLLPSLCSCKIDGHFRFVLRLRMLRNGRADDGASSTTSSGTSSI